MMEDLDQIKITISSLLETNNQLCLEYIEHLNKITNKILERNIIENIEINMIFVISSELNKLYGERTALKQIGNVI